MSWALCIPCRNWSHLLFRILMVIISLEKIISHGLNSISSLVCKKLQMKEAMWIALWRKYSSTFRRWNKWTTSHNLVPIPTKPHKVAYNPTPGWQDTFEISCRRACITLSWVHSSARIASPSTHPFIKAALEGLKWSHTRPVVKKEPLTVKMLKIIVDDAGSLSNLHLATKALNSGSSRSCISFQLPSIRAPVGHTFSSFVCTSQTCMGDNMMQLIMWLLSKTLATVTWLQLIVYDQYTSLIWSLWNTEHF